MILNKQVCVAVGLLVSLLSSLGSCKPTDTPAPDAAARLGDALSCWNKLDLRATARLESNDGSGDSGAAEYTLTVKRLGSRALISRKQVLERSGQETARIQKDFVLCENGDVLDCQAMLEPSLKQTSGTEGLGIGLHSKRLAGSQRYDNESVYYGLNDLGAALWIIGYLPLRDYLDNASEIRAVAIGEGEDVRIAASCDYGRLKLVVSPSNGWLPESFELIKEPQHYTIRGRVAEEFENMVSSIVWSGKVEGFKKSSGGCHAPRKMVIERRTNWTTKPVEVDRTSIDFEAVTFDPPLTDRDFVTDIVFPVGYRVAIMGAPHLPYKWDGRAVVPGVPDLPEDPRRLAYERVKHSGHVRTIVVSANLILLAIIAFVLLWKRGRAST